jgi:hypothetical protein
MPFSSLTVQGVAVRAVHVPREKLMVDFNQGLALGDAMRRCHALDDLGLYWFEEPTAYNNLDGYAQLARELHTPIQLGENFYGPREYRFTADSSHEMPLLGGSSPSNTFYAGQVTTTYWYAPAAQAIVRSVHNTPYQGSTTVELVEFTR